MKATFKAIIASLLLAAPAAQAVTITFDEPGPALVHGSVVDSQYSGITISAENYVRTNIDEAVAFDTSLSGTRDDDLEAPFGGIGGAPDAEPGNVLILQENDFLLNDAGVKIANTGGCADGICDAPDDEGVRLTDGSGVRQPTGRIRFDFDFVIELLSLDYFDVESLENGTNPFNRVDVWDPTLTTVTTVGHSPDVGNNNWSRVLFDSILHPELKNVGRIDVYLGGSGAIDNLSYNVVPIPASVWLFGTALVGFIGFARRRSI